MSTPTRNSNGLWPDIDGEEHYKVDNRVLISAVACLVFVIVVVIFLHIYARRALHRHRRRQYQSTIARLRTAEARRNNSQAQNQQKTGLDASFIAAMPTLTYRPVPETPPPECVVCLSLVEEGEVVRVLPNCKHVFHVECVDVWLHSHSTCPLCRAEAEPVPVVNVENGGGGLVALAVATEAGAGQRKEESSTSGSRLGASFRRMLGRSLQVEAVEDLERR